MDKFRLQIFKNLWQLFIKLKKDNESFNSIVKALVTIIKTLVVVHLPEEETKTDFEDTKEAEDSEG